MLEKIFTLLMIGVSTCAMAGTEEAIFVATNSNNAFYGEIGNWEGSGGSALTLAPTNGENVILPDLMIKRDWPESITLKTGGTKQRDSIPYLTYPSVDPTIGKLTGSYQYVIRHGEPSSATQQQARRFTVEDPDGFNGFFYACDALSYLTLPATVSRSLRFPNVSAASRLHVEVPTAGTFASIESVYEDGAIEKNGEGILSVKGTVGVGADFYVREGGLELSGCDAESSMSGLLARAAVHFDPSEETLETFAGENGLTCVSKMNDVRGGDVFYAVTNDYTSVDPEKVPYCHAPFVAPTASPTGLRMLDFGSKNGSTAYGPNYCFLAFKDTLGSIREAFYVVETEADSRYCNVLGGNSSSMYDFLKEDVFLVAPYGPCAHVWGGDLAINGKRVVNQEVSAVGLTAIHTVSIGTRSDARANMLACNSYKREGTGGFRMGEMLIFTNELTRAERVRINAYLNAKWRTGEIVRDAGVVFAANASTPISVPSGSQVHVRAVQAPEGLVKNGGGTLKVDRLYPENARVTLNGGDIAFGSLPAIEEKVAQNASIWLDAMADGVFDKPTGASEDSLAVYRWKDWRDLSRYAECPLERYPSITTVAGKIGVDFGLESASSHTYMTLPNWKGGATVYAGFIAVKSNRADVHNIFGSSDLTMLRRAHTLLHNTYQNPVALSAHWTVDGEPVDPLYLTPTQLAKVQSLKDWHVIAFSGTRAMLVDGLSVDRNVNSCGQQTVGELILFDRPITTEERVGTEAYLIRKWLGTTHPELGDRKELREVAYDAASPNVISSDGDLDIGKMMGGTGVLVKKGAGSVAIGDVSGLKSISVEGGVLTLPDELAFVRRDALFCFDASDANAFTTTVGEDYSGKTVTNVVQWIDSRENGVSGVGVEPPYARRENLVSALPTLVNVETAPGVRRTVLDCGTRRMYDSTAAHKSAAAFGFNQTFANVVEVYGIVADAHGENAGWFWGDWQGSKYDFARGKNGALFGTDTCDAVKTGDIRIDGTGGHEATETLASGYHLLGVVATGPTTISSFALDRSYRAGGVCIGESLAFSRQLSQNERTCLEKYLMCKWLGGEPAYQAYESVDVTIGARLDFGKAKVNIRTDEVSGGGVIDAERIQTASLKTAPIDAVDFSPLTVSGTLEFVEGASVVIPVNGKLRSVHAGKYALARASFIEPLVGVTVESPLTMRFSVRLSLEDGVLYVTLQKKGMAITIR